MNDIKIKINDPVSNDLIILNIQIKRGVIQEVSFQTTGSGVIIAFLQFINQTFSARPLEDVLNLARSMKIIQEEFDHSDQEKMKNKF